MIDKTRHDRIAGGDEHSASSRTLRLTVGALEFTARLESRRAPHSAAALVRLLPLDRPALHARWSGEAAWVPLGSDLRLDPENATAYPQLGQILLYAGMTGEPELLIPYGACAFASRAGALAGNHVATIDAPLPALREIGELLLWKGAQRLRVDWD
jgi:uncharacterized protein DUF3830